MIIHTSAIVCVLLKEPGSHPILRLIQTAPEIKISAANYLELITVIDRRHDQLQSEELDDLIEAAQILFVPFGREQAHIARRAFRLYGKGMNSRSKLNFGDCFAYALAKETGEPLLFVGNDFVHTDILPALDPPVLASE